MTPRFEPPKGKDYKRTAHLLDHNVTLISILLKMQTSGTPEVCQLPAGMAGKNHFMLYSLYVTLEKQNNKRAAVRQCSSTYGSKGHRCAAVETVVLSSTSGRPIF